MDILDSIQLPLFTPNSDWECPRSLPNLSNEKELAIDLETKDPLLKSKGAGYHRKDGHISGVAVATSGDQWYFPIGHLDGNNLDPDVVVHWLKDTLASRPRNLIFANAPYDLGWLHSVGIDSRVYQGSTITDVAVVEGLLDEEHPDGYSLNAIARRRIGSRKNEALLHQAAEAYNVDAKAGMWKMAPKFVGPYAEDDARITFDIWKVQELEIKKEGLEKILDLERKVTPVLHKMGMQGVRVDLEAAEKLNNDWKTQEKSIISKLGITEQDIWTQSFLVDLFRKKGWKAPTTDKGNPSFTKEFIRDHEDETVRLFAEIRELSRLRTVFVESNILGSHIRGRVYPSYVQLAREEGGTRSGRLACRNPNIQQIPKRSRLVDAKRIRSLYVPDNPDSLWAKLDYSSQEPRLQVHYGMVCGFEGAAEAARYFAQGKKLYHLIEDTAKCSYDDAKMIYLGLSYNMGKKTLAKHLNITVDEANERVYQPLAEKCPFLLQLGAKAEATAKRTGEIRTLCGRRRRFHYVRSARHWDHVREGNTKKANFITRSLADFEEFFGSSEPHEPAYTNKAGNALIQGSAADQTKLALIEIDRELGTPLSQVHDEINIQVDNKEEAEVARELMEGVVKLKLPVVCDCDLGPSWQ